MNNYGLLEKLLLILIIFTKKLFTVICEIGQTLESPEYNLIRNRKIYKNTKILILYIISAYNIQITHIIILKQYYFLKII